MVFLAAVVVTSLFWAVLPASMRVNTSNDYFVYYEPVARNVLEGRGLITAGGDPAILQPPGYSFFLVGVFGIARLTHLPEGLIHALFILVCTGLSAVFIYLIARSIWRPLVALGAPLLWMTYPLALWLTKQPYTEVPFMTVFYGAVCLYSYARVRQSQSLWWYLGVGGLIGCAMLIRPIAIGLGIVLAGWLVLSRTDVKTKGRLALAGMLLLGNLVVIFPWQLWVNQKTDKVVLLSAVGTNSIKLGLTFAVKLDGFRRPVAVPEDVEALMRDLLARYDEMQTMGEVVTAVREEAQGRPWALVKIFGMKMVRSWYATDSGERDSAVGVIQTFYLALLLLSTIVAWRRGGNTKALAVLLWILVAYFWILTVITAIAIVRYLTPVIGLLFVLTPVLYERMRVLNPKGLGG